jgi:hypothetical protein
MELGQLGMGDPQLDRALVTLNRVDRLPGNQLLGPVQPEADRDAAARPLETNTARQAAGPDVDAHQQQIAVYLGQLEVVDTHNAAAVHVHDLLIEHLAGQPQL